MINPFKIEVDTKRVFGLDILRFCAVMSVVIGHSIDLLPNYLSYPLSVFVVDGVAIFFVLSGFLIGGILIKIIDTKEVNWKLLLNFWIRRWFRTLPNYLLILILLALYYRIEIALFLKYALFSQNLTTMHPWFFPEAWSLSIEEWFYLLIPFLIFTAIIVLKINKKQAIVLAILLVLIAIASIRYYRFVTLPIETYNQTDLFLVFKNQVFTRLDSLMFGVIGAYISFYHKPIWQKNKGLLLVTGLIIMFINERFEQDFVHNLGYFLVWSATVKSIATLFTLPFLSSFDLKSKTNIFYKLITIISLISYSMYLINYTLMRKILMEIISITTLGDFGKIINFTNFWLVTVAFSILIYKYFEMPFTKLREKF
jgi:peptidoglycan/LPS O-acetylase OafA/YrhL